MASERQLYTSEHSGMEGELAEETGEVRLCVGGCRYRREGEHGEEQLSSRHVFTLRLREARVCSVPTERSDPSTER